MNSKKPIVEPATERSTSQSKKKKVELDLPEILDGELRKEAEDECRTLEQHILYILKNRHRVSRETWIVPSNAPMDDLVHRNYPRQSPFWEVERNWDSRLIATAKANAPATQEGGAK